MEVLRDPLWQFIGAVFAFVTISISLGIYLLQKKKKIICYEIISKSPLLSWREEKEGKFKISYEGQVVNNVLSVIIQFTNNGNQPIASNDFERKISISFNDKSKILSVEAFKVEPPNLDLTLTINENQISISPLLLNPKDSFTIRAFLTESDGIFNLDYRIIGVNKISEGPPSNKKSLFLLLIGLIMSLVGMLLLAITDPNTNGSISKENPVYIIAIVTFLVGYLMIGYAISINKKLNRAVILTLRRIISKYT